MPSKAKVAIASGAASAMLLAPGFVTTPGVPRALEQRSAAAAPQIAGAQSQSAPWGKAALATGLLLGSVQMSGRRQARKAQARVTASAAKVDTVGIIGCSGAVGKEMLECLEDRKFPTDKVRLFGNSSAGTKVSSSSFGEIEVEKFSLEAAQECDICLMAVSGDFSLEWGPKIAGGPKNTQVIDNSSAWRYDKDKPLVIPEINGKGQVDAPLIANPNCTTAVGAMALWPIHQKYKLKKVLMSTYQAASGAGAPGMAELEDGLSTWVKDGAVPEPKFFAHQLPFNVIPQIDKFQENGYTKEEMKVTWELQKIFGLDDDVKVSCTAVRVPTLRAHSETIVVETEEPIKPDDVRKLLESSEGVKVVDDPESLKYPMPLNATGHYDVEVGRIRQSIVFGDHGIEFFVSGDQLLRGAALNAVIIAEDAVKAHALYADISESSAAASKWDPLQRPKPNAEADISQASREQDVGTATYTAKGPTPDEDQSLKLNRSQAAALRLVLERRRRFSLVQGPPGTGKTTTAVSIICGWTRRGPVLASAFSNRGTDNLAEVLHNLGVRVLRVGLCPQDRPYSFETRLRECGKQRGDAGMRHVMETIDADTSKQFASGVDSEDLCSGQLDLVADIQSDDDKPEPEFHWIESQLQSVLPEIPIVKCWMPPALSPSELCAAHIVLNLPIVDAVRAACERTGPFSHAKTAEAAGSPELRLQQKARVWRWSDGRGYVVHPVYPEGRRQVCNEVCFTRALLHLAGHGLSNTDVEVPKLSSQHFSVVEMQDFCRFLRAGSREGTLVRRSLASLEVFHGDGFSLQAELCDSFDDLNRDWISSSAMAALEGPAPCKPGQGPAKLALDEALQMQDMLIAGYSAPEFQAELHRRWEAAGGMELLQVKARQEACAQVQYPILQHFGFQPSRRGVAQSVAAFKEHNAHPEVAARNAKLQFLVNPPAQDEDFKRLMQIQPCGGEPSYAALRLPSLYHEDRELVRLVRQGLLGQLRAAVEHRLSNPNTIVPEKLGFLCEARTRFYFIEEKTALMVAVEEGNQEAFDLLLGFHHLLDVNVICREWSLSAAYKTYTALDIGRNCVRAGHPKCAKPMVRQLLAQGAKSAEALEVPPGRQNPFLKWREYFPDAKLDNIGAEYATGEGEDVRPDAGPQRSTNQREASPVRYSRIPPKTLPGFAWNFPDLAVEDDMEFSAVVASIKKTLRAQSCAEAEDRQRLLRQLFLEWHPDKRRGEVALATKVFQWLQRLKEQAT
ncbi:asd [Symbiodinium necroappetens]|uniref:aspartate-semialdehyde dehydrogenase n=1 Tax=Symbiodinium necroappetens TaxID=1628268 RepID=A0A813C9U8_9DINO|nr:asd [Symbiodinium necroappetens]